jgi:phosphatidylserine/phosphatidylglycerophosphate/cardiolipin synthase-like enzyme
MIRFDHVSRNGDGQGGAKDSLFGLGKPDHFVTTTYTTNDNIRVDVQFTPQSPSIFQGSSLDTIINYIQDANERIYLAQFVISSQDVADAMKARHDDAGVEILGLGDSSFFGRYYSEFMDMEGTAKLNDNGVFEVDDYTGAENNPWANPVDVRVAKMTGGDKFHQKYFIIDDMVISGSHNVSGAAAFGNDENIVAIFDPETAGEFTGHFYRAFCETDAKNDCDAEPAPVYEDGTFDGVFFKGSEIPSVLDLVNNATMAQLDDDAAMNKTAAQNIIAARPIDSMQQLSAVKYVGTAAMQDLLNYSKTWK